MVRFRQKEFFAPLFAAGSAASTLLNAATIASIPLTGAQMYQQHSDSKEAEEAAAKQQEQLREQNNLIRKQNEKIDEIKRASPALGNALRGVVQKSYAAGALVGNAWKAAKPIFGKGVVDNAIMGAATGGSVYLAGKYIQGKEKKKEESQQSSRSGIGSKVLGGAATLAGLGLAAKKGFIPGTNSIRLAVNKGVMKAGKALNSSTIMRSGMKDYARGVEKNLAKGGAPVNTAEKGKILRSTMADLGIKGQDLRKSQNILGKAAELISNNKGSIAMGAAFGGVPLVFGYTADKSQQDSQQERTYALPGSGVLSVVKSGYDSFMKNPGRNLSSGISSLATLGIASGKKIQKFGDALIKMGNGKSGGTVSNATVKVGEWIKKHPTAANWASVVPGAAIATAAMSGPEKILERVGRKVDPGAYAYRDAKNQQVQQ